MLLTILVLDNKLTSFKEIFDYIWKVGLSQLRLLLGGFVFMDNEHETDLIKGPSRSSFHMIDFAKLQ